MARFENYFIQGAHIQGDEDVGVDCFDRISEILTQYEEEVSVILIITYFIVCIDVRKGCIQIIYHE